MEITKSLTPNCSEFTFYVNLSKSTKKAKEKFEELLKKIDENAGDLGFGDGDATINNTTFFGTDAYIISSNSGGDHGALIHEALEKTGVKFEQQTL